MPRLGAPGHLFMAKLFLALLVGNAAASLNETSASNSSESVGRVIGGEYIEPGEFPFLVSIDNCCAGSIIDDRHILTAAHCVTAY
jgi:secreted trypsin-like serine protease